MLDEIKALSLSFLNLSIYSLKNKKCELLNNEIELIDESFYENYMEKTETNHPDFEYFKYIHLVLCKIKYIIAVSGRLIHYCSLGIFSNYYI